jgi:hypothetical protein
MAENQRKFYRFNKALQAVLSEPSAASKRASVTGIFDSIFGPSSGAAAALAAAAGPASAVHGTNLASSSRSLSRTRSYTPLEAAIPEHRARPGGHGNTDEGDVVTKMPRGQ